MENFEMASTLKTDAACTVQQNIIKFRFPIFFKTCTIRQQYIPLTIAFVELKSL